MDDNYELWLLRYAEGELSEREREMVEAWLAGHPEAAEELALYASAPRLERNESVGFVATLPPHTEQSAPPAVRPLWPMVARWSAAAAVVAALMLPALRMGSMAPSDAPLLAKDLGIERMDEMETVPVIPVETIQSIKPVKSIRPAESTVSVNPVETIQSTPDIFFAEDHPAGEEVPEQREAIPVGTLISVEEESTYADATRYTSNLIAIDNSADWGDLLLVTKTVLREELASSKLGALAMRSMTDNGQLEHSVVAPLRERLSDRRNRRR